MEPTYFWGAQESYWIAFYKFCEEIGVKYDPQKAEHLNLWSEIAQSSGWWWAFDGVCIISERPSEIHFEGARLHNASGMAVKFRDGWGIYFYHGVRVPGDIIEQPQTITVARIEAEANAEIRRVMIEIFGLERFILESGAEEIHQDNSGILYRKNLNGSDPLLTVRVRNSTPEPDGHYKDYFLQVHHELRPLLADGRLGEPQTLTAKNAVASTFGCRGVEYAPVIET